MAVRDVLGGEHEEHESAHGSHDPMTPEKYKDFRETMKHLKHGALRHQLGLPKDGSPIPVEKLEEASHSKDELLAHRARLALAFRHMSHGHHSPHEEEFGLNDAHDEK